MSDSTDLRWMLGGDPPEPAEFPEAKPAEDQETGLATHTGVDPNGRAIGPAEDHTEVKPDIEGEVEAQTDPEPTGKRSRKS